MATINIYLTFNGDCEEAFNFYKSVFGGDFSRVARFSDMPKSEGYPVTEIDPNRIMYLTACRQIYIDGQ